MPQAPLLQERFSRLTSTCVLHSLEPCLCISFASSTLPSRRSPSSSLAHESHAATQASVIPLRLQMQVDALSERHTELLREAHLFTARMAGLWVSCRAQGRGRWPSSTHYIQATVRLPTVDVGPLALSLSSRLAPLPQANPLSPAVRDESGRGRAGSSAL